MINQNLHSDSPSNWEEISQSLANLEPIAMPEQMNDKIFNAVNNKLNSSAGSKSWLVYMGSLVVMVSSFAGWKLLSYDTPSGGVSKIEIAVPEKKKQKRVQYAKRVLPKPTMKTTPNIIPLLATPEHIHSIDEKVKPAAPVEDVATGGDTKK